MLLLATTLVTTAMVLGVVRWLAPGLLGVPPDLRMVRVAERVPPFFDGVFRPGDYSSAEYLIPDPVIKRAKPQFPDLVGLGPNDLLGFRNRSIPRVADLIAVGDSQTYGNNAPVEGNWPSQLRDRLTAADPVLYNVAVGGWGAVEYLEIFRKLPAFQPRAVVVAFYAGNDPLDSFRQAYASERWADLRPDPTLNAGDAPAVAFPAPEDERWAVTFPDGLHTTFTPKLRYASNRDHPASRAGYEIMAEVGRRIGRMATANGIELVFTVIPTKELAHAPRVRRDVSDAPRAYRRLVAAEAARIRALAAELSSVPGARYQDVVGPMQQAALDPMPLYPADANGHPTDGGYAVIAAALEPALAPVLPPSPAGPLAVDLGGGRTRLQLVRGGRRWLVPSPEMLRANGWSTTDVPVVQRRRVANLPYAGTLNRVEPAIYGPSPAASP